MKLALKPYSFSLVVLFPVSALFGTKGPTAFGSSSPQAGGGGSLFGGGATASAGGGGFTGAGVASTGFAVAQTTASSGGKALYYCFIL